MAAHSTKPKSTWAHWEKGGAENVSKRKSQELIRIRETSVVQVDETGAFLRATDTILAAYKILLSPELAILWSSLSKNIDDSFQLGDSLDVDVDCDPAHLPILVVVKVYYLRRNLPDGSTLIRGTGIFTILENKCGYIRSELFFRDFDFAYNAEICPDFNEIGSKASTVYTSGNVCLFECCVNNNNNGRKTVTFVIDMKERYDLLNFNVQRTLGVILGDEMSLPDSQVQYYSFKIVTESFGVLDVPPWAGNAWKCPSEVVDETVRCVLSPRVPFQDQDLTWEVIAIGEKCVSYYETSRVEPNLTLTPSPVTKRKKYGPFSGAITRKSKQSRAYVSAEASCVSAEYFTEAQQALIFLSMHADPTEFKDMCDLNKKFIYLTMKDVIDRCSENIL